MTIIALDREDLPAIAPDELAALSETALTTRVLRAASSVVATAAARELLTRAAFPQRQQVPLAETLTPAQRAAADVVARREYLELWPFAVPPARATRARWLGLEPPTILEKIVTVDVDSTATSMPLRAAMRALKLPFSVAALSPWATSREVLDLYAEVLLRGGYGGPNVFDHQEVAALLDEHAADFVPAAEALLAESVRQWTSTDTHAAAERGTWTSRRANALLAHLMLYPLALAGRTLGADEASFVPFRLAPVGARDIGRTVLLALREDLREPTVLAAYEELPTLTAVTTALDVLRFLPLPALATRVARDIHDPAFKKSVPKVPFQRVVDAVAALCADMPELAPLLAKPKPTRKKAGT